MRVGIGMAMGMTILISAVILLIRNPALGLFTSDANVVNYGSRMIVYMVTFYFAYVPIEILSGAVKGAGDSFIGGFAFSLLQGASVREAAQFAARCSAVTISHVGAQDAMPTYEDLLTKNGKN